MAKKLTKAQRRVLRDLVRDSEVLMSGSWEWMVLPRFRSDTAILGKLWKRGYAEGGAREIPGCIMSRLWPTAKGYAALYR